MQSWETNIKCKVMANTLIAVYIPNKEVMLYNLAARLVGKHDTASVGRNMYIRAVE